MSKTRKKKEKLKFTEWIGEQNNPQHSVYFITGKSHWAKEFVKGIVGEGKYKTINDSVHNEFKKMRYKPLDKDKHIVFFENHNKIKEKDLKDLLEYCQKEYKHSILIIAVKDWNEKRKINKMFREALKFKWVTMLELDYPNKEFIYSYVISQADKHELEFENKKAVEVFLQSIGKDTDKVVESMVKIKLFTNIINITIINELVEQNFDYNYDEIMYNIINVKKNNRKLIFRMFDNLVQMGRKESTIFINIRKRIELVYQAKCLKMSGVLRENDFIEYKKSVFDELGYNFSENNIWKQPEFKINSLLRLSDKASLSEILYIRNVIDSELDINNKKTYYKINRAKSIEILDRIVHRKNL